MAEFEVPIVKRELLPLWREFWDSKREPSEAAKSANADGSLGRVVFVKARTKAEAVNLEQADNLGFVVIPSAARRGC